MKKTWGICSLIVIILSITFVSAATNVYVDPPIKSVVSGEEVSIDVKINTNESILAGSFALKFDPSFMYASSSSEGDFLKQGGSTYTLLKINNTAGEVTYDSTRFDVSSGATGNGILFNVNFSVIAGSGFSSLNITNAQVLLYPPEGQDPPEISASTTSGIVTINSPPSASSLVLIPSLPKTTDALQATYNYSDPEGDLESGTEIRWYKNNVLQSAYNYTKTVPSSATIKGEQWYFTVKPKDGKVFGTLVNSSSVTIQNTEPLIENYSPNLSALFLRVGRTQLFNQTSSDADGDALNYSWKLDGVTKETSSSWNFVPATSDCGNGTILLTVSDGSATGTQSWNYQVLFKGDVDLNEKVDIFDLAAVGLCYGRAATGSCANADLNQDGNVNIFDLATVGLDYGGVC